MMPATFSPPSAMLRICFSIILETSSSFETAASLTLVERTRVESRRSATSPNCLKACCRLLVRSPSWRLMPSPAMPKRSSRTSICVPKPFSNLPTSSVAARMRAVRSVSWLVVSLLVLSKRLAIFSTSTTVPANAERRLVPVRSSWAVICIRPRLISSICV